MSEMKNTQNPEDDTHQERVITFPYQMTGVRLRELHAKLCKSDADLEPTIEVALLGQPETYEEDFVEALQFRVVQAGEDSFELSVTLEGQFKAIVDPDTIDREVLDHFTNRDVITILWPYIREVVHSMTGRMNLGLPPLPIVDARRLLISDDEPEPPAPSEETTE